jgi:hypothetical protein
VSPPATWCDGSKPVSGGVRRLRVSVRCVADEWDTRSV